MLLALVAVYQITLTLGNPFHKYPFVFLLDVGNEELEKTNTEQIRVSTPGGSIALRYPAIGDGDTIAHVRVSGIDFGTDLKANIVEGGPGFNYVVLAFIGNPEVPYDAVVTLKTVPNNSAYNTVKEETNHINMNTDQSDPYGVELDNNDSAEDTSDYNGQYVKMNSELTQSSSNVYSYAIKDLNSEQDYDEPADQNEQEENTGDYINEFENEANNNGQVYENLRPTPEKYTDIQTEDVEDYADETQDDEEQDPRADKINENDDFDDAQEPVIVDRNLYNMYKALRPNLNYNNVIPQDVYNKQIEVEQYKHDPAELDQMFNDEEIHNDGIDFDSNNNHNFDTDDSSAVES